MINEKLKTYFYRDERGQNLEFIVELYFGERQRNPAMSCNWIISERGIQPTAIGCVDPRDWTTITVRLMEAAERAYKEAAEHGEHWTFEDRPPASFSALINANVVQRHVRPKQPIAVMMATNPEIVFDKPATQDWCSDVTFVMDSPTYIPDWARSRNTWTVSEGSLHWQDGLALKCKSRREIGEVVSHDSHPVIAMIDFPGWVDGIAQIMLRAKERMDAWDFPPR